MTTVRPEHRSKCIYETVNFLNVKSYDNHLSVSWLVCTYSKMDGRRERFKICLAKKANTSKNKLIKTIFSIFNAMLLKLRGTRIKFMQRSFKIHMKICILTCWLTQLVYVGELYHSYTSGMPKTFTTPYAQYSQGTSLERLQLMSLTYSLGAFRIGIPSVARCMVNEHMYTYNGSVENGSKWYWRGNVLGTGVPISRVEFSCRWRCTWRGWLFYGIREQDWDVRQMLTF